MAKKDQSMGHSFYKNSKKLHKSVKTYAGGACLTGHEYKWEPGNSCSYRWQGLKKAEGIRNIYNNHDSYAHLGKSNSRRVLVSAIKKSGVGKVTKGLKKALKSAGRLAEVEIKNFTNSYTPYDNQVHHVLPNSTLRNGINVTVDGDADLAKDICDGLLEKKYNINFQDNMIILPVKWKDACKIGLPTHNGDHPAYRAELDSLVCSALAPYQQVADQGENHGGPDYEEIKEQLESISDYWYTTIKDYGQSVIKGKCGASDISINKLPDVIHSWLGV